MVAEPKVQVETVKYDKSGSRQIGAKTSTTELLQNRREDIEAAVREASSIIQDSVAKVEDKPGWRLTTLEARFGITLAAEAGVVLSRVSAEASFEVTVTIERH
jgi:Trypsin-co-occurring domain 1